MADENSRFLHRHMYFPEYCRDLPSSTLNVRLMYTLFHKVTNQGCRYVLVMQQATPQDAHRTQNVGVVLPTYLDEFRVWLYQNKLHPQKEKPLFCQALAAWWREGLLLMERFIPGIYRCTMALTNIHSGLICNASPDLGSYISLWIPFILHSVHSILCFFTHKAL